MQAEHIPVHLGAMPAAVAAVLELLEVRPGEAYVLNDPYQGGTHLPDITVITPVFADGELLAFAAARAHHADVGAPVAGVDARRQSHAGRRGRRDRAARPRRGGDRSSSARGCGHRPSAAPTSALSSPPAGRASGDCSSSTSDSAGPVFGPRSPRCSTTPNGAREHACARCRTGRGQHATSSRRARSDLELVLAATVSGDRLTLDFSGSAPQHEGNLNCPLAVTRSACYFAVRVLTDADIPASAGAYRPVEVIAPEGSLLNARPPAAVAAGNVETSSRVADVVLAAFGRALGQGTMNNLTLGTGEFVYYETIGGGQGACADADGPSGVHVAMSNTLNTPIEALELEFPLRMTEYSIRRGSGGAGAHRGGDGVVRELQALAPMTYSLITERRRHPPRGAAGGEPAAIGRNLIDGEEVAPKATGELAAGQRLRIETPGGGGYGLPG